MRVKVRLRTIVEDTHTWTGRTLDWTIIALIFFAVFA